MQKMKSTSDVLDDHLTAIRQGDLNAVLSDYASDAVLFREDGVFKGVDAIRSVLEKFVAEFQKPGTISHTKQRLVEGDCAYMVWTAETADNVYELATDTFVVRNGKIVAQSFTAKITPKRQLTAPPKREPVDSAMTGTRAQWESGLETLSGIRQWKLRLQLAGRTAPLAEPTLTPKTRIFSEMSGLEVGKNQ